MCVYVNWIYNCNAIVPENKRASAIAIMFTGLTVATITGVPIGTFIGQQFGWRASFMAIVVIGIIAFIANSILVPSNLKMVYLYRFVINLN